MQLELFTNGDDEHGDFLRDKYKVNHYIGAANLLRTFVALSEVHYLCIYLCDFWSFSFKREESDRCQI